MRRKVILLGSVCAVLLVAAPSHAVIGGTPDTTHPYVGLVASGGSVCSGALVTDTVFVTAAHCIVDPDVKVRFGSAVSPATPFTEGTAHRHPGFCFGCGAGLVDHDLAVVVLDDPVAMPVYASLPSDGAADVLRHKSDVTVVGYGVSFFVGPQPFSTFQRLGAGADAVDEKKVAGFLKLKAKKDGAACFGDSGGPNFLPGTHTMLAVTSYSQTTHCTSSSYSYRLDTTAARAFLDDFVALP